MAVPYGVTSVADRRRMLSRMWNIHGYHFFINGVFVPWHLEEEIPVKPEDEVELRDIQLDSFVQAEGAAMVSELELCANFYVPED